MARAPSIWVVVGQDGPDHYDAPEDAFTVKREFQLWLDQHRWQWPTLHVFKFSEAGHNNSPHFVYRQRTSVEELSIEDAMKGFNP